MALSRFRSILVVAGVLLALGCMVGVAFADSAPGGPPIVKGGRLNNPPGGPVVHSASLHAPSQQAPTVLGASLPFTGADIVLFLGIGLILFTAGLAIFRRSRPRAITS